MKILFDEASRRFPGIRDKLDASEVDQPYTVMQRVVEWLRSVDITPDIVNRARSFAQWCLEQPRGETASDDLYTVLVVAFYEGLFDDEHTQVLLPAIITREEFSRNREYLIDWVGKEKYEHASKYFH